MKKKKLLIKITEPCQEAWEKMSPRSTGRHCDSCNKTVTDFVGKSDAEIVRLLQSQGGAQASACGRFTSQQLNREIRIGEEEKSPDLLKWLAGLLLAGSTGQAFSQELQDSLQSQVETTGETGFSLRDSLAVRPDSLADLRFYGTIVDKDEGQALLAVRIKLSGTDLQTISGKNGHFSLVVPHEILSDTLPLIFTFYAEGFEIKSVFRKQEDLGQEEQIRLKSNSFSTVCILSGDITIVSGNFVPSVRPEPEIPMLDPIEIGDEDNPVKKIPNDAAQQVNRPGRSWLMLPFLQAVLPSRRRRKK
ncbi:MAG: hypothetical protein ACO1O6_00970 [Bacteroidota bacterium]